LPPRARCFARVRHSGRNVPSYREGRSCTAPGRNRPLWMDRCRPFLCDLRFPDHQNFNGSENQASLFQKFLRAPRVAYLAYVFRAAVVCFCPASAGHADAARPHFCRGPPLAGLFVLRAKFVFSKGNCLWPSWRYMVTRDRGTVLPALAAACASALAPGPDLLSSGRLCLLHHCSTLTNLWVRPPLYLHQHTFP